MSRTAEFPLLVVDLGRLMRMNFDRRAAKFGLTRAQWRAAEAGETSTRRDERIRAALAAGLSYDSIRRAEREDPEFAAEVEQAHELFSARLSEAAYKAAVEGWKVPKYEAKGNLCGYEWKFSERILELLVMSDAIRSLVMRHVTSGEIRQKAIEEGMQTMYENGLHKVVAGVTSHMKPKFQPMAVSSPSTSKVFS